MKTIALMVVMFAWISSGLAQSRPLYVPKFYTSHTGQFIAQSLRQRTPTNSPAVKANRVDMAGAWAFVLVQPESSTPDADRTQALDPTLLPTACERIKGAILQELNLRDQWRGRVILNIDSSMKDNTEPVVVAIRERNGFRYEVWLPASLKLRHLSRALVHVILLEMANREATEESTHIPLWLVEGMLAHIKADSMPSMLLQPNQSTPVDVSLVSLDSVRSRLQSRPALTFQEMSWPRSEQYLGKGESTYRASSELFVYELVNLPNGRDRLARFIEHLPRHLNWQVGFLEAFSDNFTQLRDVEKWWGLQCLSVTGEDISERWPAVESGRRFQNALDVPVNVHFATNRMPTSAILRLQDIILQWNISDQRPVLERVFASLHALRPHLDAEFRPLASDYMEVLSVYINRHSPSYIRWIRSDSNSSRFREATARKLIRLDEQLAILQGRAAANDLLRQAQNIKGTLQNNGASPTAMKR